MKQSTKGQPKKPSGESPSNLLDRIGDQVNLSLIHAISLPVVFFNNKGAILYANPSFISLTELPRPAAYGKSIFSFLDLKGNTPEEKILFLSGYSSEGKSDLIRIQTKNKVKWVDIEAWQINKFDDSDEYYFQCILKDCTAERNGQPETGRSAQTSRELDALLEKLADLPGLYIIVQNINGVVTWANRQMSDTFGSWAKEPAGKKKKLKPGSSGDAEIMDKSRTAVIQDKRQDTIKAQFNIRGNPLLLSITTYPVFSESGEVISTYSIGKDIASSAGPGLQSDQATDGTIYDAGTTATDITSASQSHIGIETLRQPAGQAWLKPESLNTLFESYMNNLSVPTTILDLDGNILFSAQYTFDFWKKNKDDVIHRHFTHLVGNTHYVEIMERALKKIKKTKEPVTDEIIITEPNGKEKVYTVNSFPLLDKHGTLFAVGVLRIDITREREKERDLEKTNKQLFQTIQMYDDAVNQAYIYESYLNSVPVSSSILDLEETFIFMNQTARDFWGIEYGAGQKVRFSNLLNTIPSQVIDVNHIRKLADIVIQDRKNVSYETNATLPGDDREHIYIFNLFPLFNMQHNLYAVGINRIDITEQREKEKEMERSHQQLAHSIQLQEKAEGQTYLVESFLDNLPFSAAILDLRGTITFVNQHSLDYWETKKENVIDKHFTYLLTDRHYSGQIEQMLQTVINKKKFVSKETVVTSGHDDKEHYFLTNVFPLFNKQDILFAVGILRIDISDRKEKEMEIEISRKQIFDSQQLLQDFLDRIPNPALILDKQGRVVLINESSVKLPGSFTTQEQCIGKVMTEFITNPETIEAIRESNRYVLENQKPISIEEVIVANNGEPLYLITHKFPIYNSQNELSNIGIIYNNITENVLREKEKEQLLEKSRQQEELLRTLINSTPDWIFIKDQDHRYRIANMGYANALHLSPEDFVGKNDIELGFPEELVKGNPEKGIRGFWTDDRMVMESGQMQVFPDDPATIDGVVHTFHTIKSPLKDADGKTWGVLAFARDITKEKQTQEALLQNEKRFRELYNSTPAMLYSVDKEGTMISVSDYWLSVMGYTKNEVIGRNVLDFLTEKSRKYAKEVILPKLNKTGNCYNAEYQFIKKDSSIIDCLLSATCERGPDGMAVGLLIVITDITERKQVEKILWQNEQLLQSIMDNIPQSIFWKDTNLTYLGCNRAFAKDAGLTSPSEIIGKTDYDLPWQEQAEQYRSDDKLVIENNSPKLGYEEQQTTPEGTKIWIRISKIPVHDTNGRVTTILGTYENITERKKQETEIEEFHKQLQSSLEQLSDSQRLLQDFIEGVPVSILILDLQERVVLINKAGVRLQGPQFTKADFLGKDQTEYIYDSNTIKLISESNRYVLENQKPISLQEEIKSNSGERLVLTTYKFPIYTKNKFTNIGVIIENITERLKKENELILARMESEIAKEMLQSSMEKLMDSQRLMQDFLDGLPNSTIVLDLQERIVLINEAGIRISGDSGLTKKDIIGKNQTEYMPDPEAQKTVSRSNRYVLEKQKPILLQEEIPTISGEITYLTVYKFPIYNSRNEFTNIGVIINDITERVLKERELVNARNQLQSSMEKLLDSQRLMQDFLDGLPNTTMVLDLQERVVLINEAGVRLQGAEFTKEHFLGKNQTEYLSDSVAQKTVGESNRYVIENQKTIMHQEEIPTNSGETAYLTVYKFPIYNSKNEFSYIGVIINDITNIVLKENELKEAKRKAENAASAQERFLAAISHDMRTPLNGIVGMINLMKQTPLSVEQTEFMDAMEISSMNLQVLINDILDISKIQAGKLNIECVLFDLAEILNSVEEVFKHEANKKNIRFSIEVSTNTPTLLEGDPARLNQILNNLVGNAIKFTNQGYVKLNISSVNLSETMADITFEIEDSGIGLSVESIAKLFRPFTQARSDTTRRFGGTGLGLSICKNLVELQQGKISVTSEINKGSVFKFNIPYKRGKEIIAIRMKSEQQTGDGASIRKLPQLRCLIVEDNLINQKVAYHSLKKSGITSDIANNGYEAIEILKKSPYLYDFILMDVQMPEMDGYQATSVIRNELNLKIPIIAMTASALKGEKERCLESGMNDFVPKPFMIEELLYVIQHIKLNNKN